MRDILASERRRDQIKRAQRLDDEVADARHDAARRSHELGERLLDQLADALAATLTTPPPSASHRAPHDSDNLKTGSENQ